MDRVSVVYERAAPIDLTIMAHERSMRDSPSMRIATTLKSRLKKLPVLGPIALRIKRVLFPSPGFPGTIEYWEHRYATGGNSGSGSFDRLARFKAQVINEFVIANDVSSVIEHGCGDGNQVSLGEYSQYLGIDVSKTAIALCTKRYLGDRSKTFMHIDEYKGEKAELAISLDVIFHLVEEDLFREYMRRLFNSSLKFVVVYSSNDESLNEKYGGGHERHRRFTDWVEKFEPDWHLVATRPNLHPFEQSDPSNTSFSNFYFFSRDRNSNTP